MLWWLELGIYQVYFGVSKALTLHFLSIKAWIISLSHLNNSGVTRPIMHLSAVLGAFHGNLQNIFQNSHFFFYIIWNLRVCLPLENYCKILIASQICFARLWSNWYTFDSKKGLISFFKMWKIISLLSRKFCLF